MIGREEVARAWPHVAAAAFSGVEESVADVRRFVADALAGTGFDVDAAVLAVSELAANAVLYSRSRLGTYDVWIGCTSALVQVLVVDEGPLPEEERPADLERCGGLGLPLVQRVAGDYGHYNDAATGCHIAWFRLTADQMGEGVVPRG